MGTSMLASGISLSTGSAASTIWSQEPASPYNSSSSVSTVSVSFFFLSLAGNGFLGVGAFRFLSFCFDRYDEQPDELKGFQITFKLVQQY